MSNFTEFDYLLNSFEQASQADKPAEHGYGERRRALYAYVRNLEAASAAKAEPAEQGADDRVERLKQEAQIHAQEARTANATIAEIYQIVTGKTGEPGNWNGAEPVRKCIEELRARLEG